MNLDRRLLDEARSVRALLGLAVGLGVLGGIATIVQAGLLSRTVTSAFLEGATLTDLTPGLLALVLIVAVRALAIWAREAASARAAARVKAKVRDRLLVHLFALGPGYTWGERTGELVSTATEGVEALDSYFSHYLPSLALSALVPLTIVAFVLPVDLLSALVFLFTAPLIPFFMVLIGRLAESLTRRQWTSLGRMNAHFLDVLQGLTTLKLFNRSKPQAETIRQVTGRFAEATLGVLRVAFLSALVLEMAATVSTAIVAVEVGLRLLYGTLGFEHAFFVLILAPEFYLPLRNLGASFHAGMAGVAASSRIYEVLGTPVSRPGVSARSALTSGGAPQPAAARPPSIRFEDVHFSYGPGRPVLRGASFEIRAGERVALVGPVGAGKSTIVSLLLGFVAPVRGKVLVDGVPIGLRSEEWRSSIALVPQTPYIFNGTVAENLKLARPHATAQQLERAADLAGASGFIRGLPSGYDTVIGEHGARLSGGEAQRLALARAFLKDAPLLILDEPASHLDAELAASLDAALGRLSEGRTVLVIAHRASTARRADRVLLVCEGRVEEGRPSQQREQPATSDQRSGVCHAGPSIGSRAGFDPASRNHRLKPSQSPRSQSLPPSSFLDSRFRGNDGDWSHPLVAGRWSLVATFYIARRLAALAAPHWPWMALAALLGFATVASGVGLMSTASFLLASAALHPSVADLAIPIVGVRFFGISRGIFRYLERYVSHLVTFRLLAGFRVWLYESLEPRAARLLAGGSSGDLASRLVADVEALQHFYARVLAPPAVAVLVGIAACLWMAAFSGWLAWTLALSLLISGIAAPLLTHRLALAPGVAATRTRANLQTTLADVIRGMPDILAFGQGRRYLELAGRQSALWVEAQERLGRIGALHGAFSALNANLGMLAVLAVAAALASSGELRAVYIPPLAMAALASFEATAALPAAFQHLGSTMEAGRRLFEVVDPALGPAWSAAVSAASEAGLRPALAASRFETPLVIEGLTFRYGPDLPLALQDISLELRPGRRVGIAGPSGAGKSTLVHLLARFWDGYEGRVVLFGRELPDYPEDEVRRLIAVVSQQTHIFGASLRENLLIARPGAGEERLRQAIEGARFDGFVGSLPNGLDTWVGERGTGLSGGQRRQVAIARALLRDAPILILDEPTANLDASTAAEVLNSIQLLAKGRSTLHITHDLAGLEQADEILVLQSGRIVERGSHASLLRAGGPYRATWDLQTNEASGPGGRAPWSTSSLFPIS